MPYFEMLEGREVKKLKAECSKLKAQSSKFKAERMTGAVGSLLLFNIYGRLI